LAVELSGEIDPAATFGGWVYAGSLTYQYIHRMRPIGVKAESPTSGCSPVHDYAKPDGVADSQTQRENGPFSRQLNERPCVMRGGR